MAKIREHIGDIEVRAERPGWYRYKPVYVKRNPKANRKETVAAYEAAVRDAFWTHHRLLQAIIKAKPELRPSRTESMNGIELIAPNIGYIELLDQDRNGKWDWVIVGKAKEGDIGTIRTTRSVDLHAHLGYLPEGERPLVEKAIDRSIRQWLGAILPSPPAKTEQEKCP